MNLGASESRQRYEGLLRNLGAYLDQQGACQVSLLEAPDGFVLRHRSAGEADMVVTAISFEDVPDFRSARGTERPGGADARYQDFFRALGHELDEERAHTVFVDELEGGFLLSYHHLDARQGFHPVKRLLTLGARERKIILEHAYARRSQAATSEKGGLFAWLFR